MNPHAARIARLALLDIKVASEIPGKLKPRMRSVRLSGAPIHGLSSVVPGGRLRGHWTGHHHVLRPVLPATAAATTDGQSRLRSGDIR